jgi:hypothetical protein
MLHYQYQIKGRSHYHDTCVVQGREEIDATWCQSETGATTPDGQQDPSRKRGDQVSTIGVEEVLEHIALDHVTIDEAPRRQIIGKDTEVVEHPVAACHKNR